jgi:glutamate dehydrogenase/leucine dehydrogenase
MEPSFKNVGFNWPFGRAKGGIHGPATTEAHDILHERGILVMLNVITNVGTSRSAI